MKVHFSETCLLNILVPSVICLLSLYLLVLHVVALEQMWNTDQLKGMESLQGNKDL